MEVCTATDRLHDGPGVFRVLRCASCGLMRTDPRPAAESMRLYYPAEYGPYLETAVEPGALKRVMRRLLPSRDTAIPELPPGRLLELGAASGNFLLEMQAQGWAVTGLEWDPAAAARAASRTGARVVAGGVEGADFPEGAFDLVCAWMVLEHVEDPFRTLRQCQRWLKAGGWIAFSVPDSGSWQLRVFKGDWNALHIPNHLHHFTVPQIRSALLSAGFDSVSVRWQATLLDVPMSIAYRVESRLGRHPGAVARRVAGSPPMRLTARVAGLVAAPFGLTGRVTVWARKPC